MMSQTDVCLQCMQRRGVFCSLSSGAVTRNAATHMHTYAHLCTCTCTCMQNHRTHMRSRRCLLFPWNFRPRTLNPATNCPPRNRTPDFSHALGQCCRRALGPLCTSDPRAARGARKPEAALTRSRFPCLRLLFSKAQASQRRLASISIPRSHRVACPFSLRPETFFQAQHSVGPIDRGHGDIRTSCFPDVL